MGTADGVGGQWPVPKHFGVATPRCIRASHGHRAGTAQEAITRLRFNASLAPKPAIGCLISLKYEVVYHQRFATFAEARSAIFTYIETFYNRTRLHSSLAYRSPIAFESQLNQPTN
jgi:transposase InsO family protein